MMSKAKSDSTVKKVKPKKIGEKKSAIKVFARVRPTEMDIQHHYDVQKETSSPDERDLLVLYEIPENKEGNKYGFLFQKVFKETARQSDLYEVVAKPVVEGVFNGYNGAILAYGQTGTGKTHSITGGNDNSSKGIIPRAFYQMFKLIKADSSTKEYSVSFSILEIYNELCYDLLSEECNPQGFAKVLLSEDASGAVTLRNLSEHKVSEIKEVERLLKKGMTNRTVADTPMNPLSSRSHCIFTLHLRQRAKVGDKKCLTSKLHMIDLSGSERVWKNNTSGLLLHEAKHINLSLHYLEQVIIALSERRRVHVPYRNSTITSLLRDSLGGNSHTAMVFTLSLEPNNFHETLSTCRFSQRVSMVQTKNRLVFENLSDTEEELNFLRSEVDRLNKIIGKMKGGLKSSDEEEQKTPKNDDDDYCDYEDYEDKVTGSSTNSGSSKNKVNETPQHENDEITSEGSNAPRRLKPKKQHNVQTVVKNNYFVENMMEKSFNISFDFKNTVSHINRGILMLTTLLKQVTSVLSLNEEEKLKIFDVDQLSNVMGLTLPNINPNTGKPYLDEQREGFMKFLNLKKSHKALYLYAEMNISYFTQLEAEWQLWKKISNLLPEIETIEHDLKRAKNKGEFPDVQEALEHQYTHKKHKLEQAKERLELLGKDRYESLKMFSLAKQSLLKSFEIWWEEKGSRLPIDDVPVEIKKSKSIVRLKKWSESLRLPVESSNLEINQDSKVQNMRNVVKSVSEEPGSLLKKLIADSQKKCEKSLFKHLKAKESCGQRKSSSVHDLKLYSQKNAESSTSEELEGPDRMENYTLKNVKNYTESKTEKSSDAEKVSEKPPSNYGTILSNFSSRINGFSKPKKNLDQNFGKNVNIKLTGDSDIDKEILNFYKNRGA